MASEHSIRMDYERAKAAAAKLDDIADRIQRMMEHDYTELLGDVRYNWKGENADRFIVKSETLQGKMNTVVKRLHETADTIRRIAKNTYDAEMRALEIARQREYAERQSKMK